MARPASLYEGLEMSIGGKDVGLECRTTRAEYHSGTCFGQATTVSAPLVTSVWALKSFAPLKLLDATGAEHCFNREEGYTFGASRSSFTAMQIPNQREYHQSRESLDRKLEKRWETGRTGRAMPMSRIPEKLSRSFRK